ncbi:MAG: RdgB/HAM1 family non-canonical purine NTP pyrophosphatase [Defluviitaleaceae bacterium]|nr:RdgB/HAM1 family non-canonical purine NTP pyrophosphatase [Defluviitaleaceae bacterium]
MTQSAGVELLTLADLGLVCIPEETGGTFEANALIKARAVAALAPNYTVVADDSGLCIDALDGAPGVDSAIFMGEDTPYSVRNAEILRMLASAENRAARFVCVIAAVFPDGRDCTTRATIEGQIALAPAGENGFGYDPIFFVPHLGKTIAELTQEDKNAISHRGKAFREMLKVMKASEFK